MCKILCVAGLKPQNSKNNWKFLFAASTRMGKFDVDGIGFAAMTAGGQLFGERWVDPDDAFRERFNPSPNDQKIMRQFGPMLVRGVEYNSFGNLDLTDDASAVILHSRMATTPKGLINTHPFVINDTALIHNGIIRNTAELKNLMSTCDSETILTTYLDEKVDQEVLNVQKMANRLQGYYACGVLGKDATGPYMDVFKNAGANLIGARIVELDAFVLCTALDILEDVCRVTGMTMETVFHTKAGYLARMDVATGAVRSITPFTEGTGYSGGSGNVTYYPPARHKHSTAKSVLNLVKGASAQEQEYGITEQDILDMSDPYWAQRNRS